MSQNNQIKEHLENGFSITPIEALQKYGVFRLAARISDLKKCGLNIKTKMVIGANNKKYALYYKED